MLWEPADPGAALTERFSFASAAEATDWVSGVLAEHWGLKVAGCERLVISDSNCLAWIDVNGCRMIAKWSMRPQLFARLAAIARLTVWLGERGIPVSMPQAARDGRVQVEVDGFSLGLQRVADGEADDLAQAAVLLGTRYHRWRPTPADVRGAFVAAYESVLPLTEDDAGALEDRIDAHLGHISWPG